MWRVVRLTFPPRINARETKKNATKTWSSGGLLAGACDQQAVKSDCTSRASGGNYMEGEYMLGNRRVSVASHGRGSVGGNRRCLHAWKYRSVVCECACQNLGIINAYLVAGQERARLHAYKCLRIVCECVRERPWSVGSRAGHTYTGTHTHTHTHTHECVPGRWAAGRVVCRC
jgi:hypothetical protein